VTAGAAHTGEAVVLEYLEKEMALECAISNGHSQQAKLSYERSWVYFRECLRIRGQSVGSQWDIIPRYNNKRDRALVNHFFSFLFVNLYAIHIVTFVKELFQSASSHHPKVQAQICIYKKVIERHVSHNSELETAGDQVHADLCM